MIQKDLKMATRDAMQEEVSLEQVRQHLHQMGFQAVPDELVRELRGELIARICAGTGCAALVAAPAQQSKPAGTAAGYEADDSEWDKVSLCPPLLSRHYCNMALPRMNSFKQQCRRTTACRRPTRPRAPWTAANEATAARQRQREAILDLPQL